MTPEAVQIVREMQLERYRAWLESRIDALKRNADDEPRTPNGCLQRDGWLNQQFATERALVEFDLMITKAPALSSVASETTT